MSGLESQFGVLRSIQDDELELMLAWRNEPSVRHNMYTTHEITLDEHIAWWDRIKRSAQHQYFMFELGGKPLGIVGFNAINQPSRNSSWAFYASPNAPAGSGTLMEMLALDYAFRVIDLHKLYCEVLAFNKPVIKLHQKFGFKVEGVLRDQYCRDDSFIDIYRLGILATEWEENRDSMLSKIARLAKG